MNITGCPAGFARDTFFKVSEAEPPCLFSIPFYAVFVTFATIVYAGVAYSRMMFILKRARSTKNRKGNGRLNSIQKTTIVQSWISFIVFFAALIVPFTYGTANNVMVFIFGLQSFLFWVSAIRWLNKLVRLGSRIIDPSKKFLQQELNTTTSTEDALSKLDLMLKVSLSIVHVGVVVQVVFLCILALAFPASYYWFLAGVGLTAFLTTTMMLINIYHYQRCKNAIYAANERVKRLRRESSAPNTLSAVRKFQQHQLILLLSGAPASLVLLLMSLQVIPMTYYVFIINMLCDFGVNGTMFLVFIMKASLGKTRKVKDTTEENGTGDTNNATGTTTERTRAGAANSTRLNTAPLGAGGGSSVALMSGAEGMSIKVDEVS